MVEYCVTGGTGFIAAYLVKTLLEKGHTVRTTVRDPGMCQYTLDLLLDWYHFLQDFPLKQQIIV